MKKTKRAKAEANTAASTVLKNKPKGQAGRKLGEITAARAAMLQTAKFKAAHATALADRAERKKSTMCPEGKHDLRDPRHVHTGFLFREGGLLCRMRSLHIPRPLLRIGLLQTFDKRGQGLRPRHGTRRSTASWLYSVVLTGLVMSCGHGW